MTMKIQQPMGCSKSNLEVYSKAILPQKTRKTSKRQSNFTSKTTGNERTKIPQSRKEINWKNQSRNK